jgi:AAA domain
MNFYDEEPSAPVAGSSESWESGPPTGFDDSDAPSGPTLSPTADEPLRGLSHLGKIALVGLDRLRSAAGIRPHYVWDQVAVAATIILIASGPSEGKTTLLCLLLAARANLGESVPILGRLVEPARPGTWIVFIEGEHSESSAARKLLRSAKLLGTDAEGLGRIILIARKAVRLGSPEWADVVRLVAAGFVSDIAIDTVARVAPGEANDEREQTAIFDLVAQAIEAAPSEATRPTAWANAHTRKNGRTGDVGDVAGSVQRTGQADSVLMLDGQKVDGRTVSTRVVFAKLREEPDEYPLPVTFSISGDELHTLDVPENDDRPLETRIEDYLQTGPKTKSAIASSLGRSRADVEAAISNLFAGHRITTTQVSVNGRSFKAFTLRADAPRIPPAAPRGPKEPTENEKGGAT